MTALEYIKNFVTDPDFQERQPWVRAIIRPCAKIPANYWTLSRAPGGVITDWLFWTGHPALGILAFTLFALTDYIDGKVARWRGESTVNGGLLDGTVDKIFVLPVLGYLVWVWQLSQTWKLVTYSNLGFMILSELSRLLMPLSSRFNIKEHAFAIYYGKAKFSSQVGLVGLICLAINLSSWSLWPFWINVLISMTTLLSLASILFRLYPELERYLADVVTLSNLICGSLAILVAPRKNWVLVLNLILLAATLDAIDGVLARKLKGAPKEKGLNFGAVADDLGDLVSFAIAPAVALYYLNPDLAAIAKLYFLATFGRLAWFTWLAWKGTSTPGVFSGLPSPAAAVGLLSFFIWSPEMPSSWVGIAALTFATLELLFGVKWYHFRWIGRTYRRDQVFAALAATAVFIYLGPGPTLSVLVVMYVTLFVRPIANRAWRWDKRP